MIGLITYHSAYNFGSMLQALATQYVLEQAGYDVKILNYRTARQKEYYSLYHFNSGFNRLAKDLLFLPRHADRVHARDNYESFMTKYMHLTKEFSDPKEFPAVAKNYDAVISGSDQIWNKHSFELSTVDWEFMFPYLLKGFNGKKISYASSIGAMSDDELKVIIDDIRKFNHVSMREKPSADRIANLVGEQVPVVLDPTLLLNRKEWEKCLDLTASDETPYLVYYSLKSYNESDARKEQILSFARSHRLAIKCVTPKVNYSFGKVKDVHIEYHHEYGPREFFHAIYNATAVLTDSYHGTILSLNMGKDIYSYCGTGTADFRKTYILEKLGMSDRVVSMRQDLNAVSRRTIDYEQVQMHLEELRQISIDYLLNGIKNE